MLKSSYTRESIQAELKQRQNVLEWMVRQNIVNFRKVSRIIAEYYVNPGEVVRAMERNLTDMPSALGKRKVKKVAKSAAGSNLSILDEKSKAKIEARRAKNEQIKEKDRAKLARMPEQRRVKVKPGKEKRWLDMDNKLKRDIDRMLDRARGAQEKDRLKQERIDAREARKKK